VTTVEIFCLGQVRFACFRPQARGILQRSLSLRQGPLLRVTAWTGLPAALRDDMRHTMSRLGERFAALVVDGMVDASLRIVDPSIAAQVVNGAVNAAAELERWVPGMHAGNAFELYAMPLFSGLQSSAARSDVTAARPDATALR